MTGRRWRPLLVIVVGLALSAGALWLALRGMDLGRTVSIALAAQPVFLAGALGVIGVQALVRAARWRLLLPLGPAGRRLPIASVLPAMLVGYLGNAVMPARLGEVVRSALIARRESVAPAEALGSAILERILDVFVLAGLGAAAAVVIAAPPWITGVALAGGVVAAVGLSVAAVAGFVAHRRAAGGAARAGLAARLAGLAAQLAAGARLFDRPLVALAAAALTLAAWLLDASVFWLVARSLGFDLSPAGAIVVSAIAVLSTAVPTAPGYIGTFELAAVAGAGASGIVGEPALAFALLAHVMAVVPLSLAGAAALWAIGGRSLRNLATTTPASRAVP